MLTWQRFLLHQTQASGSTDLAELLEGLPELLHAITQHGV